MSIIAIVCSSFFIVGCYEDAPRTVLPDIFGLEKRVLADVVRELPPDQLAGQLLLIGIEDPSTGRTLREIDKAMAELLREVQPGGVILYGDSFDSPNQVRRLISAIDEELTIPGLVATDYEGGLVSRLTDTGGIPATRVPPARAIGNRVREGSVGMDALFELGVVIGRELRATGVTMNFAPVADVDPAGAVGSIGRHGRTFGDDPVMVGRVAAAIASGIESEGVAAVVKHFPGHGAVEEDSHVGLPLLEAERTVIDNRELEAFREVFAAAPSGIMTAHMVVPSLDSSGAPATLSRAMLTELARKQMGYNGLIITDALNMQAVRDLGSEAALTVAAVHAGADLLLKPVDANLAKSAIVEAMEDGRLSRTRVEESVWRILWTKAKLGLISPFERDLFPVAFEVVGSEEHQAVIRRIMGSEERSE